MSSILWKMWEIMKLFPWNNATSMICACWITRHFKQNGPYFKKFTKYLLIENNKADESKKENATLKSNSLWLNLFISLYNNLIRSEHSDKCSFYTQIKFSLCFFFCFLSVYPRFYNLIIHNINKILVYLYTIQLL